MAENKCCRRFSGLAREELEENNLVYGLLYKTSALRPRTFRIAFFFLVLLLEFTFCAFFYNRDPDEEEGPLFWDGIAENFWVAVYTAILISITLALLSLLISFPRGWKRKLEESSNPNQLKRIYHGLLRRQRARVAILYSVYGALTLFLLLYLIGFGHVASQRQTGDWLRSAALTFLIEEIALEIAACIAWQPLEV